MTRDKETGGEHIDAAMWNPDFSTAPTTECEHMWVPPARGSDEGRWVCCKCRLMLSDATPATVAPLSDRRAEELYTELEDLQRQCDVITQQLTDQIELSAYQWHAGYLAGCGKYREHLWMFATLTERADKAEQDRDKARELLRRLGEHEDQT